MQVTWLAGPMQVTCWPIQVTCWPYASHVLAYTKHTSHVLTLCKSRAGPMQVTCWPIQVTCWPMQVTAGPMPCTGLCACWPSAYVHTIEVSLCWTPVRDWCLMSFKRGVAGASSSLARCWSCSAASFSTGAVPYTTLTNTPVLLWAALPHHLILLVCHFQGIKEFIFIESTVWPLLHTQ